MPRLRTFLALFAIALVVAGVIVVLVPVSNDVQDCGVPIVFLADGRVDVRESPDGPDVTECSELSGRRLGAAVGSTVLAGVVAIAWAVLADRQDRTAWTASRRTHTAL